MRIDLSTIDREQFVIRDCVIAGDECVLVFPSNLAVDWTPETLHLRSLIVRKEDGRIISRGQDKFLNHGEKPHLYPDPTQFKDWRISTKLDGSLIIVSMHRDELIARTRGTATIDVYETGTEVRALLAAFGADKWLTLRDTLHSNSLLFEHTTPANRIVIAYDKPSLTLLDVIAHDKTGYWSAKQVDQLALVLGCARPDIHSFGSLDEIIETLKTLKGIEGYVLAYNDNRNRVKLKGLEYLTLHRFKSRVTLPNLLDLFFAYGRPDLATFTARIEKEFDHECLIMARELVTQICAADVAVTKKVAEVKDHVDWKLFTLTPEESALALRGELKHSRRDFAVAIQAAFQPPWTAVAFKHLDKRDVDDKMLRKLMEAEMGI